MPMPREGVDPPNVLSPMPSTTSQETGDISAQVPDFSREVPQGFWDPSRKLLRALRAYQKWQKRRGPHAWFLQKWAVLRYHFWTVVTASDIPINTQLGGGLLLLHPVGVVMHPTTTGGPNCLILQHVTITPPCAHRWTSGYRRRRSHSPARYNRQPRAHRCERRDYDRRA